MALMGEVLQRLGDTDGIGTVTTRPSVLSRHISFIISHDRLDISEVGGRSG